MRAVAGAEDEARAYAGLGTCALKALAQCFRLLAWVEEGEFTDVKTTISTYWLDRYRRGLVMPKPIK
jgi:hypothetical protein